MRANFKSRRNFVSTDLLKAYKMAVNLNDKTIWEAALLKAIQEGLGKNASEYGLDASRINSTPSGVVRKNK